jgi:DNA-binding response OmpR family regulator
MSPYRILIVEDQREVSRLLRSALETLERDLVIVELPSAEEALLESSRKKVDLLISDYRLPGISGIELFHKVRKNHPQVKIILITGQTDPQIRKEVADAGADAFFIKPVPITDFLEAVERHLGLVETILPPEPIAMVEVETKQGLPDLLSGLRQELAANAVLLLNDNGSILARAGNYPDSNDESTIVSSLVSIHTAGNSVSRVLGQKAPSNWHLFHGGQNDLIFAPIGTTHSMVVIGKGLANETQLLKTIDAFSAARMNIEEILGESTPEVAPSQETPALPQDQTKPSEEDMASLFKGTKKRLIPSEVDDFWNDATNEHITPTKPDMLSYEQAKKLGLTPEGKS